MGNGQKRRGWGDGGRVCRGVMEEMVRGMGGMRRCSGEEEVIGRGSRVERPWSGVAGGGK